MSLLPALPQAAEAAHPLLWVAKGKNSTVYLFGSIHIMKAGTNWLSPALRAKFDSAGSLWLETADIENTQAVLQVFKKYSANPANNMTEGLSAGEIKQINDLLQPMHANVQKFMGLRKWAVGLLLLDLEMQKLGFDPKAGVDRTFYESARATHKPVYGFEGIEEGIRVLVPENDKEDKAILHNYLKDIKEADTMVAALFNAWLTGDEAEQVSIMHHDMETDEIKQYKRVINDRTDAWEPKVEKLINGSGTAFVVVGEAHIVGEAGLVAQLRQHGFTVEQVKY